jgi:hypothetical protein
MAAGTLASVLLLAGCVGDASPGADALRAVELGTLKGEVYRALGPGPVDSLQVETRVEYGYPILRFIVEGEAVEVFWVPQAGYAPGDSISWRESTPVLFQNLALVAWGWDDVEPLAREKGISFAGMAGYQPRQPEGPPEPGEDPTTEGRG